jgi:hypothetical protein
MASTAIRRLTFNSLVTRAVEMQTVDAKAFVLFAEKTCRLSSTALAGSELVAGRRAADHTTNQPAPAQREGREHVRAAIASHVGGRCHPVARCMLRESPDPHVIEILRPFAFVAFDRALCRGVE